MQFWTFFEIKYKNPKQLYTLSMNVISDYSGISRWRLVINNRHVTTFVACITQRKSFWEYTHDTLFFFILFYILFDCIPYIWPRRTFIVLFRVKFWSDRDVMFRSWFTIPELFHLIVDVFDFNHFCRVTFKICLVFSRWITCRGRVYVYKSMLVVVKWSRFPRSNKSSFISHCQWSLIFAKIFFFFQIFICKYIIIFVVKMIINSLNKRI